MRSFFLSAAVLLSACGPITFSTQVKGEGVIQGNALGQFFNVFPQLGGFANIDFNQNQDFKNNNTDRDKVKSMKVTGLSLRIVSPSSQDFSFLETLEFAVKSGDMEQKVAGKTGINGLNLAAPNPTLELELVDADISPFVRASSMTIITRGTGRQPAQDTRLEATMKFLVGVGL